MDSKDAEKVKIILKDEGVVYAADYLARQLNDSGEVLDAAVDELTRRIGFMRVNEVSEKIVRVTTLDVRVPDLTAIRALLKCWDEFFKTTMVLQMETVEEVDNARAVAVELARTFDEYVVIKDVANTLGVAELKEGDEKEDETMDDDKQETDDEDV